MAKPTVKKYNISEVEPITIPNKNIQSYYMKTDTFKPNSTVIEEYKNQYPTKIVYLVDNSIIIESSKENENKNSLESDTLIEKDTSILKLTISESDNKESPEKETTNDIKKTKNSVNEIKNDVNEIKNDVNETKNDVNETYRVKLYNNLNFNTNISLNECIAELNVIRNTVKNCCVCLIFSDFLTRTEIIALIDFFINDCNCKSILLLPNSLAVCMGLKISGGIVLIPNKYFSYIEDNVLIEGRRNYEKGFLLCDDFDIVDEIREPENKQAICEFCGSIENPIDHFHTIKEKNDENFKNKDENDNKNDENDKNKDDENDENDKNKGVNDENDKNKDDKDDENDKNKDENDDKDDVNDKNKGLNDDKDGENDKKNPDDICICGEPLLNEHEKNHISYEKKEFLSDEFFDELKSFVQTRKKIENFVVCKEESNNKKLVQMIETLNLKSKLMIFDKSTAIEGAKNFLQIEIVNELWITNKDWWNGRIKTLRERVLFYI